MEVGVCSDKGKVRKINEDYFYVPKDIENDIPLFIVADGMGGHRAGDVASKEAVNSVVKFIKENLQKEIDSGSKNLINLINNSIMHANRKVYTKSLQKSALAGMGTTFAMVLINKEIFYIGHVGDSRIYVLRRNNLYQLTKDHSYVEELVTNGTITREEAANHPQKNIITRAIGTDEFVETDMCIRKLYKNDLLILCTDGLTNMLAQDEIKEIAEKYENCNDIAKNLVERANQAGGVDNITVIVIKATL